jgi:hypothetical protein
MVKGAEALAGMGDGSEDAEARNRVCWTMVLLWPVDRLTCIKMLVERKGRD